MPFASDPFGFIGTDAVLFESSERPGPPRLQGLTCLIDNGLSTNFFCDVIQSHSSLVDLVKFGWGTSAVTADMSRKLDLNRNHTHIRYFLGGTLFEKAVQLNKVEEFVSFCRDLHCPIVEVSDGSLEMERSEKKKYIEQLSADLEVYSDVGYKSCERSLRLPPSKWVEFMTQDLDAGASKVVAESRESGTSGICRSNGEVRYGLIEDILNSTIDTERIFFEAPSRSLQVYFLTRVGCNVNLANVSFNDVVALETLRWGLRGDTFDIFGKDLQTQCSKISGKK